MLDGCRQGLNARGTVFDVVIVVATSDFEVYHEVVEELRDRGADFTTVQPGDEIPDETTAVITGEGETATLDTDVWSVEASAEHPRKAVETALAHLRGVGGRIVVGIDPGTRPGVAVLAGDVVIAAFQIAADEVADLVRAEVADAVDPIVRVGDGARLQGARIIGALDDVTVELVDETGTTPYLGSGARGMGDVLAAVNIARLEGREIEGRTIEPTKGELTNIKTRSRERSSQNRTISEELARRVATGELTLDEAIREHATDST